MADTYWMIERNSKHKRMPPNESVMWFKGRICLAGGDTDNWIPHSDKAKHFSTKQEAEEYAKTFVGDDYDPPPDVTEHLDCSGPDLRDEPFSVRLQQDNLDLRARIATLETEKQAWKEFAEHQVWCQECADAVSDCEIGSRLRGNAEAREQEEK